MAHRAGRHRGAGRAALTDILLDTFPRRQHPVVLSMFGMAVGVAPVVGPVLGGYLAEA
jgi:MFS family permease